MSTEPADNTCVAESKAADMVAKEAPQQGYNEWAAAMSAYYAKQGPAAYYGPAQPHPHPYMWGAQPMMPYGTPPPNPYYSSYHPSMAPPPPGSYGFVPPTSGALSGAKTPGSENGDMAAEWNKSPMGAAPPMAIPPTTTNTGRTGDSGSEGSSGSDSADMLRRNKRSFDTLSSDGVAHAVQMGAQNGTANGAAGSYPQSRAADPVWPGMTPAARRGSGANLATDIVQFQVPAGNGEMAGPAGTMGSTVAKDGCLPAPGSELWQDEREVKRQRRKQSNRESARRSRLRKQAECEDLGSRVNALTVENMAARQELLRLTELCQKLEVENASLKEKLRQATAVGTAAVAAVEAAPALPPAIEDVPAEAAQTAMVIASTAAPAVQVAETPAPVNGQSVVEAVTTTTAVQEDGAAVEGGAQADNTV